MRLFTKAYRFFLFGGFFLLIFGYANAQSASIVVERLFYSNSFEAFDEIQFLFNGVSFSPLDTVPVAIPLKTDLDECQAIIGEDTLDFYAKFKPGEAYVIHPGCCCAAFTLKSVEKGRRGTALFKNRSQDSVLFNMTEAVGGLLNAGETFTDFAHESAMCLFKPVLMELGRPALARFKYDTQGGTVPWSEIMEKRDKLVIARGGFHFLHGEKIEVMHAPGTDTLKIKLLGYLTDAEYEKALYD